jgi:tetratricopeptide (TPR) repeat protein
MPLDLYQGSDHPPKASFDAFLHGRLQGNAAGKVLAHWVGRCPACQDHAAPLTALVEGVSRLPEPRPEEYDEAVDRAFSSALAAKRGLDLFERKVQSGLAAARDRSGSSGELDLPLRVQVEVELRSAWTHRYSNPETMLSHARQAVADADQRMLPEDCGGAAALEDLRARVHSDCANAWRINDNFGAAIDQINRAFGHWRQGTSDELIEAHLHWVHAGILADLHHFDRAQKALDLSLRIYRRNRLSHQQGRTLIAKGGYYGDAQEPGKAVELIRQGLRRIDPAQDPTLELAGKFNLVSYSVDLGRLDDAHREAWGLAARFEQMGQPMNALRARWLQGKIHLCRGEHDRAEREYSAARDGFLERGHPYDTALLSFELAVLRRAKGEREGAERLLLEALSIFQSYDLRDYTLAALHLFQKSFRDGRTSVDLLLRMITDLEGAIRRSRARAAQAQARGEVG